MTPESVEALVERVRRAVGPDEGRPPYPGDSIGGIALAALTELAERVKAAERLATENGRLARFHWDRAEAAARERDEFEDAWRETVRDLTEQYGVEYRKVVAQRDELVEALERAAPFATVVNSESPREAVAIDLANWRKVQTALAKVRGEAE